MVAFGAPLIGFLGLLAILFWAALAFPTARIARSLGHPGVIAWLLWCPWLCAAPSLLVRSIAGIPHETTAGRILGAAMFFFWLPGAVYLWVLASKLRKDCTPAGASASQSS